MNTFDSLLLSQLISALTGVGFYLAAYLSFLNLLKYPRNWALPSASSTFVTGTLAVITVAFVSVVPNSQGISLDISTMLFLSGFLFVLFGIIASPAIDFNPGSRRVVEFLANYGDTAGIWMLLPAIVGAYAFPEARLHGVLAAAISVELAWYARHKLVDKRHPYALDENDTLILNTQAKGNIEEFAKLHGIEELEFSTDGIKWNGCNKNTLPCPFNLYINRLGLNTAPCCREHMKDLAHYVSSCLKDLEVDHWLEGGSLLGAVRENGNFLAWEDDVDISFLLDDKTSWSSIAKALSDRGKHDGYYVDVFESKGFISVSYDRPLLWPMRWERNRMRGEIRLDLVTYRRAVSQGQAVVERRSKKGALPMTDSGWHGLAEEIVLPTSTIRFLGNDIPCPNEPQTYLQTIYQDYQTTEYTYLSSEAAETRSSIDMVQ
jgi:hypothetical protein